MTTTTTSPIATTPPAPWTPVYAALLALDEGCHGINTDALLVLNIPRTRSEIEKAYTTQRAAFKQLLKDYDATHPAPPRVYFNEQFTGTYGDFKAAQAASEAAINAHYANRSAHTESHARDYWADQGGTLYRFAGPGTSIPDLDYDDGPTPGPLTVIAYQGCRCCGGTTGYGDWVQDGDLTPLAALTYTTGGPLIAFADEQGCWPSVVTDPGGLSRLQDELRTAHAAADQTLTERQAAQRWAVSLTPAQVDDLDYTTYQKRSRLLPVRTTSVGWQTDVNYTPSTSAHDRATAHKRATDRVYAKSSVHPLAKAT